MPAKPSPLSEDGCDQPGGERSGGSRRSSTSSTTTAEKKKKTTLMRNRRNSSTSLSSSSSITRAMTPGPLSIDRPECTLRRRANVKVNAGVKETLTKLDEERREAEKRVCLQMNCTFRPPISLRLSCTLLGMIGPTP